MVGIGDVLALVVSAVAAVFAGLTWWNSRKARHASERSADAASRSADQAVTSADAAQRSAVAAEEQLARDDEDRAKQVRARQLAARTPTFRMGPVDWRGPTLVASATVFITSTAPIVDRVEVSLVGGPGLGLYGDGSPRDQLRVKWNAPSVAGGPLLLTFELFGPRVPARLRLACALTDEDDGEIIELDLEPAEGAESLPAT